MCSLQWVESGHVFREMGVCPHCGQLNSRTRFPRLPFKDMSWGIVIFVVVVALIFAVRLMGK